MRDQERIEIVKAGINMYDSLVTSIDKAGGYIPKEELLTMTVLEFISKLSTNNIRFVYMGK